MGNTSLQSLFFEKIKEMLPASTTLVNELEDILGLSIDSAYRRIRGETILDINEIATLCGHYKISFDSLQENNSGTVTFKYNYLKNDEFSFKEYINNVYRDLKKINQIKDSQIIFAAEDIPIFHHFQFAELASFKMFYWMKSVMNVQRFENEKFSIDLIDDETREVGEKIYDLYCQTNSVEIWTELTIFSILKQIEFYWESGNFKSQEDALLICNQLQQELACIQKQAELSTKITNENTRNNFENNFKLYLSDIELGNNCILVNMGSVKFVYLVHYTFNTLITSNNTFAEETDEWLNTLIKKSSLISGVSEKQRFQFFKKCNSELDKLIAKIS